MMRVMGFPKKLLGDGEALVLELRPHVKRLFGPAVLLVITAPVATFLAALIPAGSAQGWVRLAVAVAGVLVLLRWSVWPFLVWWTTVYVITDRRLVMRTGVVNRRGHDMPLVRLNDVTFSHSLLDRMLGCGDLIVESAGERGQVVLDDIPRVEQVQRTLYRLSDAAREGGTGPLGWPSGGGFADRDAGPMRDAGPLRDTGSGDTSPGDAGHGDARPRSWWGRRR